MTLNSGVTRGGTGAIAGDANTAFRFNGTDRLPVATAAAACRAADLLGRGVVPDDHRPRGGKIVGFGNARTGLSTAYDRHVYMDARAGCSSASTTARSETVHTTTALNDGKWHHVVGIARAGPA